MSPWEFIRADSPFGLPVIALIEERNMRVQSLAHVLNFTYEKSSDDIRAACAKKAAANRAKIEERESRIRKIREEYGITDAALVDILAQARRQANNERGSTYVVSNSKPRDDGGMTEEQITIGAGVINNLLTEKDFIEGERDQVRKLDLIGRNLKDIADDKGALRGHRLSTEELEFLGF